MMRTLDTFSATIRLFWNDTTFSFFFILLTTAVYAHTEENEQVTHSHFTNWFALIEIVCLGYKGKVVQAIKINYSKRAWL